LLSVDRNAVEGSFDQSKVSCLPTTADGNASLPYTLSYSSHSIPRGLGALQADPSIDIGWVSYPIAPYTMTEAEIDSIIASSTQAAQALNHPSQQVLYDLLAKTIFNFRPSFMIEWTLDEKDDRRRSEGFQHVTELCDVLQQWLAFELDQCSATTLAMLVTIGAELIKGAYRPLLERCLAVLRPARQLTQPALEKMTLICTTVNHHSRQVGLVLDQIQYLQGSQQIMQVSGYASAAALRCLQQDALDAMQLLRVQRGSC
jgi:hypothetical protein